MAFQKTARKDSAFRIVCILPDFCFLPTPPTPPQAPPIPFPLTTDLGKAKSVARDVLINKKPAFVFDASYAPKTFGDELADPKVPAGGLRKKGILSHTAGEAAWPFTHSSSVKIRNHYIIRTGDMFHMNNKYKGRLKKNAPHVRLPSSPAGLSTPSSASRYCPTKPISPSPASSPSFGTAATSPTSPVPVGSATVGAYPDADASYARPMG